MQRAAIAIEKRRAEVQRAQGQADNEQAAPW